MSGARGAVLMTGCASGIGRHLVGAFVSRGWSVMATDVREEALAEAHDAEDWPPARVATAGLDVRDAAGWERALCLTAERFGRVEILAHVAGYLSPGYVLETPVDEIARHLDINAAGAMLGTRVVAPSMLAEGGSILVVGSLAGMAPVPGIALYSASKFALRGYTLALAEELRPAGIRVTLISPDAVRTPMLDLQVDREEAAMTFSGSAPLGVEDIAHAIFEGALVSHPVEIAVPGHRGWLARLGGAVPSLSRRLMPVLRAQGRRRQQRFGGQG